MGTVWTYGLLHKEGNKVGGKVHLHYLAHLKYSEQLLKLNIHAQTLTTEKML